MPSTNDGTQSKTARLFVGLRIGPDIADQLAALAAELRDTRVRRVAPADIHLTLVPPWQEISIDRAIAKLRQVASMFPVFPLKIKHLGYGPQPGRPTLLWVDCAATDEMAALRVALMQAFGQEDSRPFRPHVTLARIRSADRGFPRKHPIDKDLNFEQTVRGVQLFQSPPPDATGYQILASAELGRKDADTDPSPPSTTTIG
jgi:2'-5' RNA ligase